MLCMGPQDTYFSGCEAAVIPSGRPAIPAATGLVHTHISLLAMGRRGFNASEPYTYALPAYVDGVRQDSVLRMAPSISGPPADHESRHLWTDGGVTWQSEGAVSALDLGVVGDGVTDDWEALQHALDNHVVVFLPKGFFRLGRPLLLRKTGGALVGVGRTLSILMPPSDPPAGSPFKRSEQPIVDVHADGVTLSHLTIATWDHLPAYAMHWRGSGGTWRQSFFNRMTEATFPPFSAPGSLANGPPLELRKGTPYARPLTVISGGGAFYDFNLDFGCCTRPTPPRRHVRPLPAA